MEEDLEISGVFGGYGLKIGFPCGIVGRKIIRARFGNWFRDIP